LLAAHRRAVSRVADALSRPRAGRLPGARGREDRRGPGPRAGRDLCAREEAHGLRVALVVRREVGPPDRRAQPGHRPAPRAVAGLSVRDRRVPAAESGAAVGTGAEGRSGRPDEEAESALTEVGACDIPRQLQTESTSSRTRRCPLAEPLETIYINRCGERSKRRVEAGGEGLSTAGESGSWWSSSFRASSETEKRPSTSRTWWTWRWRCLGEYSAARPPIRRRKVFGATTGGAGLS